MELESKYCQLEVSVYDLWLVKCSYICAHCYGLFPELMIIGG
uniref:Uncharacterized protein n=1 Tax=Rhizophora mucronata TaxID=61149 RepID=A0A2P2JR16_RHIMU